MMKQAMRKMGMSQEEIDATEVIIKTPEKELIISDSIPYKQEKKSKKLKIISIAPLLAEAIKRIHEEKSISILFDM